MDYQIYLPTPHPKQNEFIASKAKRKVIRAGRRGGKTVGVSILAMQAFLNGRRVLYGAPTQEQIDRFWSEITKALHEPIEAAVFKKNETRHIIELPGTEQRIRAKTCWNAETLRGDYADLLILDEWQNQDESAWAEVGAPMLLDNDGDAVFIYTPPSLHSRSASKAKDPQHAPKLYKKAELDTSGRWGVWHFTSHDNPYISPTALADISKDMTWLAIRQEIMAEDINEAPGALWTRAIIEDNRSTNPGLYDTVVVGVDPSATSGGDEAGIVVCGRRYEDYYVIDDRSLQGSPHSWASAAVTAYHAHRANRIIAEANNGGEMVLEVIRQVDPDVPVTLVHASRGKLTRAEPIAAIYEQKRGHHVGTFPELEDEMALFIPGNASPNHMDAMVWGMTWLLHGSSVSDEAIAAYGKAQIDQADLDDDMRKWMEQSGVKMKGVK